MKRCISLGVIFLLVFVMNPVYSSEIPKEKKELCSWIDKNNNYLCSISDRIWEFAEIAMLEYKSSRLMKTELKKAGFEIMDNAAGMPTAFVASYGSGKPVIGMLAEYDALPGLSQKLSTVKEPITTGAPGHGCGHNLLGTASFGGILAVKEYMEKNNIPGTIKFFGCPAEETLIGKVFMVREGLFDDVDAVIDWHPGDSTKAGYASSLAMNSFKVRFFGKTAHSAGSPWEGRSALDAVELMNYGVNMMREHVKPTVRMHYAITETGKVPNVVPDKTEVWYFVRDTKRESVDKLYEWVLKIAESAAASTQTKREVQLITGCYEILGNKAGAEIIQKNLKLIEPPDFTEEEQRFAKEIQKSMEKEEKGISEKISKLVPPKGPPGGGSTDVADISWVTPVARFSVASKPSSVPGHSWGTTAAVGMGIGHKAMIVAAKTFALTALDLLTKKQLVQKMRKEWEEKTKDFKYKCAVPPEIKPPVLPEPR